MQRPLRALRSDGCRAQVRERHITGWEKVGSIVSVQVIPRPHDDLAGLGKWLQQ